MLSHLFRRKRAAPAQRQPARRPHLEALEDRAVPSAVYALFATTNTLARVDTAGPFPNAGTIAITGLQTANESMLGIDFRPRTGQLIGTSVDAAGTTLRTYSFSIIPHSGVATFIGSAASPAAAIGRPTGFDFDPTADRIRIVTGTGANFRLDPNTGAVVTTPPADQPLTFTAPATGPIIAEAYDRNFDRPGGAAVPTTLYGIDAGANVLVRQGAADFSGSPASGSPNLGAVTAVGPLGITIASNTDGGFDIAADPSANGGLGQAFAALSVVENGLTLSKLYSINLQTGAATDLGMLGPGVEIASLTIVPEGSVVVGSGPGANADVRVFDPTSGALRLAVTPFPGFQGGVRVAAGDVNLDGVPDAVVAADAPQGHVKVFDGVTGAELSSFFAFSNFEGTVNVASGDVNGDGYADAIVVANGVNGHVKAFSGKDGSLIASFLAYPGFDGNVRVAAADLNNDGVAEIVTAAAVNGHVKIFNTDGTPFTALPNLPPSFLAFEGYLGNVTVAAGDVNGDGVGDVIVCSGNGTLGNVRAYSGQTGAQLTSFYAYPFSSVPLVDVISVGLADVNQADGRYDILAAPSSPLQANVQAFHLDGSRAGEPVWPLNAFNNFLGGATVGGLRY